jgi:hypothetical protein
MIKVLVHALLNLFKFYKKYGENNKKYYIQVKCFHIMNFPSKEKNMLS